MSQGLKQWHCYFRGKKKTVSANSFEGAQLEAQKLFPCKKHWQIFAHPDETLIEKSI